MESYASFSSIQFSHSVVSDSLRTHGLQPTRLLHPWDFPGKSTGVGCHCLIWLSCTGEGNGNPLQNSCLENPRDGGAWWAAIYGVTQSRTRLKRLSSSSVCIRQCDSLSHHLLPLLCPQVCSLCVCLYCFPAYRFISMICLDSYVCVKYNIFLFLTFFTLYNRL